MKAGIQIITFAAMLLLLLPGCRPASKNVQQDTHRKSTAPAPGTLSGNSPEHTRPNRDTADRNGKRIVYIYLGKWLVIAY